eukprot:11934383-Ditylum_brightwellii.AAC.1
MQQQSWQEKLSLPSRIKFRANKDESCTATQPAKARGAALTSSSSLSTSSSPVNRLKRSNNSNKKNQKNDTCTVQSPNSKSNNSASLALHLNHQEQSNIKSSTAAQPELHLCPHCDAEPFYNPANLNFHVQFNHTAPCTKWSMDIISNTFL